MPVAVVPPAAPSGRISRLSSVTPVGAPPTLPLTVNGDASAELAMRAAPAITVAATDDFKRVFIPTILLMHRDTKQTVGQFNISNSIK
ncbi:MAG: hypothetical protein J0I02_11665 [Alphaproteobacteria bacterium]|nr:hypothetical protein [Alphaproteobacteria bacterium]